MLGFLSEPSGRAVALRWLARVGRYGLAVLVGAALAWAFAWRVTPPRDPSPRPPGPDPLRAPPSAFEWTAHPEPAFPIPPYARFLREARIVLDPGHVGQKLSDKHPGWKTGPTGLREAEANLHVALFLREFLAAAGAEVRLTREQDVSLELDDALDLKARADVANNWPADLLLSIHHNAADSPAVNFTQVFYHAGPDHSPASLDAGRHLLMGLNDALRLERHIEIALVSDHQIHPKAGFGVLRNARVPAILSESSFHTNPAEEARLRDRLYNRREAYGMFIGLARWAQAGLPRIRLVEPADGRLAARQSLVIGLDDGFARRAPRTPLRILKESLRVRINGQPVNGKLDMAKRTLTLTQPFPVRASTLQVYVDFENVFGQHVLHPWLEVTRAGGP